MKLRSCSWGQSSTGQKSSTPGRRRRRRRSRNLGDMEEKEGTPAPVGRRHLGSFRQGQKTARTLLERPGGTVGTVPTLPLPAGGSVKMLRTLPLGARDSVGTLRTLPLPAGNSVKTLRTLPPGAGGSVKTGLEASPPAPKPPGRPNRSPGFVPSRYGGKTRNELRRRSTSTPSQRK